MFKFNYSEAEGSSKREDSFLVMCRLGLGLESRGFGLALDGPGLTEIQARPWCRAQAWLGPGLGFGCGLSGAGVLGTCLCRCEAGGDVSVAVGRRGVSRVGGDMSVSS
jgi:hypothetical protein